MITFFRKIRHKLLSENIFSKYLIYAIGEIALVVIGILIALSIDNWNEMQKQIRYERKMLNEIHTSLQRDYERYQVTLSQLNNLYNDTDSIIRFINTVPVDAKTIGVYINRTAGYMQMEFQTSAYESLKSKGLDILSDDSLRIYLSNLYDFEYPRIQADLSNYNIHIRNEWRPFMLNNLQFKVDSNSNQVIRYPIDLDKIIADPKMENILIINRLLVTMHANNLHYVMNELETVTDRIEYYLSR